MSENIGTGAPILNVALDSGKSIKEAAKWLLAAFAAVFAVLAGGLQISTLVQLADSSWAVPAIICAVVAFTSVIFVIFRAAQVLIDSGVSLEDLLEMETKANLRTMNHSGRDLLELGSSDSILAGTRSIKGLTYHQTDSPTELRDALRTARRTAVSAPIRPTPDEVAAEADVLLLLSAANRIHNIKLFSNLIRWVRIAAFSTPLAIAGLAWMSVAASSGSPTIAQPVNAQVVFSQDVDRTSLGLGDSCKSNSLDAVIIGGTLEKPLVVTAATALCLPAKFIVTPNIGISIPLIR